MGSNKKLDRLKRQAAVDEKLAAEIVGDASVNRNKQPEKKPEAKAKPEPKPEPKQEAKPASKPVSKPEKKPKVDAVLPTSPKFSTNIKIDKKLWLVGKTIAIEHYDTRSFSSMIENLIEEKAAQLKLK